MKDEVIYQLTIEDIQKVAEEEFGRKLNSKEIHKIIDSIGDRISWYEAIQNAIQDKLGLKEIV